MLKTIGKLSWYDRPWAAFIFLTRLPLWRIYQPHKSAYQSVVEYWPLVGWLTGGVMAVVLWLTSLFLPFYIAIISAIISRILLTGALHEDGLADFFDGMGGGARDRQRILTIMKDSHIGTFGVLSLIFYFSLLYTSLYSLGRELAPFAIFASDAFSKMIAGQITQFLPYARTEENSKARNVYRRFTILSGILFFLQGILPLIPLYLYYDISHRELLITLPCLTMFILYRIMWSNIRGYTGDCCGATCLMAELTFLLTLTSIK